MVYKKKESIFSLEESEFRQPAVLTLQVWDYDRIAANDFLGEAETDSTLELKNTEFNQDWHVNKPFFILPAETNKIYWIPV